MLNLEAEMDSAIQLTLIYSKSAGEHLGERLVNWVSNILSERAEFDLQIVSQERMNRIDDIPAEIERRERQRRIARSDAFLIITDGSTAPLKEAINQLAANLQARPVAFVSYGGTSGGIGAVQQVQQALVALHAVPLSTSVSFANAWQLFDEGGHMAQAERFRLPMARMLVQLNWWATALRDARSHVPYERMCS